MAKKESHNLQFLMNWYCTTLGREAKVAATEIKTIISCKFISKYTL